MIHTAHLRYRRAASAVFLFAFSLCASGVFQDPVNTQTGELQIMGAR